MLEFRLLQYGRVRLQVLPGELAVARLDPADPIPGWAVQQPISSITRTREELSIVCEAATVPADIRSARGWRCLRVAGSLDFSLTGVLAAIATPLAEARVSIFAISTYDTDYFLVRTESLRLAIERLTAAGHEVVEE